MKQNLLILTIPLLLSTCHSSGGTYGGPGDVAIFRVSDGSVVGKDTHAGRYADMVIAHDETTGKVAVIEWGDYKSTIKIFSLADSKFKKYFVGIGRLNGLDGADYYDFTADEFIFHDQKGMHFFGKNSKPREIPNPLPKDYATGAIVPCKDVLLIKASNGTGDYCGSVVYRYLRSDNSIKKIYETSECTRAIGSGVDCAIIEEDVKGDPTNRQIVRIALDGRVLSRVKMPIQPPAYLSVVKIEKESLYEAYGSDMFRLQQASLDKGTILHKYEFTDILGKVGLCDVKDNIAIISGPQAASDGSFTAIVLDIETKKELMRFKCQSSVSGLKLMKHNGEVYCIVSN